MEFNAEQQAAIHSDARNLLVLAGAGTGKTRTIIGRTLHLIKQGVDPSRIVVVTFTRRSANEIRSRLATAVGANAKGVVAGTFHHLCLRIMSSRRRWFGYSDMTLMDRDDQLQLMRLARSELVGKDAAVPAAAQLLTYYSYARNTNQPAREYLEKFTDLSAIVTDLVLKIFDAYKSRKKASSYLDYDDILHRFAKVLHDNPEVRERVGKQFDHVLVDEMQDTNPLQWLILQSLAENCALFCVGDDAQSIYAFRGADFRNVHSFSERLPNSETLKLRQNYRSTQPILDVANWLLQESPLEFDKELESVRGGGAKPLLLDFDSEFDEADWIGRELLKRKAEGACWAENMILCRTAFTARPVEAKLIEYKIPYRFIGGLGLLQMAHVRDLLSVLRIVNNHRDELAWMRYLMLWPRIGEVSAGRFVREITSHATTQEALNALPEIVKKRPDVSSVPVEVSQFIGDPVEAVKAAVKALKPLLESRYENWESRNKDFKLLTRLAANHRSVQAFLETYTLDPVSASEVERETDQQDEGVVTLITVHSAKGTEVEVCFVPAVQPGNYPHTRSLDSVDSIEEERRVLYVALTRAKDELIMTRSLERGFSRVSWNASVGTKYFFENLPSHLVSNDLLSENFGGHFQDSFSVDYDVDDDDFIG